LKTCALLLLLVLPLHANGLDDLKVALGRLQGSGPVRGSYEVHSWTKGGMGKEVEEGTGSASAWIEDDGSNLLIRWNKSLLRKSAEEPYHVKDKQAKAQDSTSAGLTAATTQGMASALDYAPHLSRLLDFSQLKQERSETFEGKPAIFIELQITPPRSEEDQKKMKEFSFTAKLWLGKDGVPLAANFVRTLKGKVLLFTMEMSTQEDCVFSVAADRLVLARKEVRETNHLMGMDMQQRSVSTFTPR